MSKTGRIIILAVLVIVIIGIMAAPSFMSKGEEKFTVTPNPADAFAKAKGQGKPVFLEFYASW
ncbi:thiol:disulfide interchange protein DsbD [Thermincola potens]|uniref:Thiol:disulfide interchange protein DsbD n=1 Tax=Thermincola potens (strain JR) TaxID=635013 RepID=D5XBI4_THEPJ|nr:thiol:disulfide interchange protein DsbD [Thermincola potens]ADG83413.1 thiol:disulfide interchange protein DsbD [Thermincola potens JR]